VASSTTTPDPNSRDSLLPPGPPPAPTPTQQLQATPAPQGATTTVDPDSRDVLLPAGPPPAIAPAKTASDSGVTPYGTPTPYDPSMGNYGQWLKQQARNRQPPENAMDTLGGLINAASRGATFDLADKASAALEATLPIEHWMRGDLSARPWWLPHQKTISDVIKQDSGGGGDIYHETLQNYRQSAEDFQAAHPVTSRLAWLTGAALGAKALNAERLFTSGATDLVPRVGEEGVELASKTPIGNIFSAGKKAILPGAGWGAAGGFANTDDTSFLGDLGGTVVGAGLGALAGPLAGMAGQAGREIVSGLSRTPLGDAMNRLALRYGQDVIEGRSTPHQIASELETLPPGERNMPVDLSGGNVLGELGRVARAPGARDLVKNTLTERAQGEGAGLRGQIQTNVSGRGSAVDEATNLADQQKTQSGPLYDQAYQANQNMASDKIDRILRTNEGQAALADAAHQMNTEMTLMGRPDPNMTAAYNQAVQLGQIPPGQGTGIGVASGLKLQTLDYVKRAMDDRVSSMLRSGDKNGARALIQLRNGLRGELDRLDPTGTYQQARSVYAGHQSALDALEAGQNAARPNVDPEIVDQQFNELTPANQEFYKQGLAHQMVLNVKGKQLGADVTRPFRTPLSQEKMDSLVRDPAEWQGYLDRAERRQNTRAQTLGNSMTAERQAEDTGGLAEPPSLAEGIGKTAVGATTGQWFPAVEGITKMLGGRSAVDIPTKPLVNRLIAQHLLETDPEAGAQFLRQIGDSTIRRPGGGRFGTRVAAMLPSEPTPFPDLSGRRMSINDAFRNNPLLAGKLLHRMITLSFLNMPESGEGGE
jgi:hypothetical protein